MTTRLSNSINTLVLLFTLIITPVFLNSGAALSAVVVDINRADAATMIANWKGIGEKKAKAIVAYRKKNGAFSNISDLANVKGIGEGLIKKNRKYMSVKGGVKTAKKTTTKKAKTKKKPTKKTDTKKSSTKKSSSSKSSKTDTKSKTKKKKKQ